MKHKVSELDGELLDAAVAMAEGVRVSLVTLLPGVRICALETDDGAAGMLYAPRKDWAIAGPIIERERIDVTAHADSWFAKPAYRGVGGCGPTPLIAAMRAYVASKFGNEVDLP